MARAHFVLSWASIKGGPHVLVGHNLKVEHTLCVLSWAQSKGGAHILCNELGTI
jgi:hypothetical protein